MNSAVVRWTSCTPTANRAAPGRSAVQGASSWGSSRSAASQTAKKPRNDATVTSSPTNPYSARARAAAPKISAHAATTASSTSAAWSGRRYRPTLPRHAMLCTARMARAADVAAHSRATSAVRPTTQRVPLVSFEDSATEDSSAWLMPVASPASSGAVRSTVAA